jgi:hypothetical protein
MAPANSVFVREAKLELFKYGGRASRLFPR